jgi:hypothetical protein
LTEEQVARLAPDAASLKAGRTLTVSNWLTLATSARAAGGEIQGSGSAPCRTRTDLLGPAFSCTCPSRKFPCKLGLDLIFRLALNPDHASAKESAWVRDWMDKRASQKIAPKPPTSKPATAKNANSTASARRRPAWPTSTAGSATSSAPAC